MSANVLYSASPSMFRNRPVWFTLSVLLIAAYGIGGFILLLWWLSCRGTRLTITDSTTTLRKGILSKSINEVRHSDVRNVQISQTLGQRMFNVGTIGVSSAGQSELEIEIDGIPKPYRVKEIIDQQRG